MYTSTSGKIKLKIGCSVHLRTVGVSEYSPFLCLYLQISTLQVACASNFEKENGENEWAPFYFQQIRGTVTNMHECETMSKIFKNSMMLSHTLNYTHLVKSFKFFKNVV